MISRVLKESAGYAPVSGDYKTILLDNAEHIREDFQQALRRVMEQHHRTTQFVITTRQPTKLIPPIRSRCFPVAMRAPTHEETASVLEDIVTAEGVDHDDDGIEYVAGYAEGDLRTAVLAAQTTAEAEGEVTMDAAFETLNAIEADDQVEQMVDAAEDGRFTDARSTLDDLLVDEGTARPTSSMTLEVARSSYCGDRLAEIHTRPARRICARRRGERADPSLAPPRTAGRAVRTASSRYRSGSAVPDTASRCSTFPSHHRTAGCAVTRIADGDGVNRFEILLLASAGRYGQRPWKSTSSPKTRIPCCTARTSGSRSFTTKPRPPVCLSATVSRQS